MSIAIGPTSLDWPAWVQAIGSVAAIALTGWLARRDGKLRERDWARDVDAREEEKKAEQRRRDRELLEEHVRFARHVGEQVRASYTCIEHLLSNLRGLIAVEDRDDPSLVVEWPVDLVITVQETVLEPLDRVATLPIKMWPDPDFAAYFFNGLGALQLTFKDLQSVYSERFLPSDAARWRHAEMATDKLHKMAAAFDHFVFFERVVREYRLLAERDQIPQDYFLHAEMKEKWRADEDRQELLADEARKAQAMRDWEEIFEANPGARPAW